MNFDAMMVRTHDDDSVNMAIGEPFIVRKALEDALGGVDMQMPVLNYPTLGGQADLLKELQKLYPGKHIVVTNGAKQALQAAFHAVGNPVVQHYAPYWPSYPMVAKMAGCTFSSLPGIADTTNVVTSPNNPNGFEAYEEGRLYDVWDAAYASPIYGWSGLVPYHRCAVFSAAKLLGLPGLRVGWLVTPDAALAAKAASFVESQTSGVSIFSQSAVAYVLSRDLLHPDSPFIQNATKALQANAEYFHDAFYTSAAMLNVGDHRGMFAWYATPRIFEDTNMAEVLTRAKVRAMPGKAFGLKEDSSFWRFSLGNLPHIHQKGVDAILAALKG